MDGFELDVFIDYLAYEVSPYTLLAFFVSLVPRQPWAVYAFTLMLFTNISIWLAYFIMLVYVHDILRVINVFIRRHFSALIDLVKELSEKALHLWWGKFFFGLLVVHVVSAIALWCYFNFNLWVMITATLEFAKAVFQHLFDWKLLAIQMQKWLQATLVHRIAVPLRFLWDTEYELMETQPMFGCMMGFMIAVVLSIGIYALGQAGQVFYNGYISQIRRFGRNGPPLSSTVARPAERHRAAAAVAAPDGSAPPEVPAEYRRSHRSKT
jgi:hypothetical protein